MQERNLLDLVSFIVDNRGRSCPVVGRGFPLIATNCVTDASRRALMRDVRYVSEETYTHWFRSHPQPNDVLFVCKGNPGRVALVPDPVPYCIAQDMVALRADPATTDPMYLYYRLSAPDVRYLIEGMHVGTLIPHFKKGDFGKLCFPVHSLPEQRRIAGVLGALDDLIETNRQFAQQVRDLSSVLYAKFSTEALGTVPLGQVAAISDRKLRPGAGTLRYIDIAAMGDGYLELPAPIDWADAPSRARIGVEDGSTLWSTVRPNRRAHALVVDAPDDLVASTGIAVLTPRAIGPAELFAASDRDDFVDQLVAMADGSAYPAVRSSAFSNVMIPDLGRPASSAFERVMWPLWRDVHAAVEDIARLRRARDELLPLLMSGSVRVREVA